LLGAGGAEGEQEAASKEARATVSASFMKMVVFARGSVMENTLS
jgi:hypothetical protein